MSPYRGEPGGIFGTLTTLQLLTDRHSITHGSMTLGLDGKSTFANIEQEDPPPPHVPHYDLIIAIRRKIAVLPIRIILRFVAGHQDATQQPLDWWARQNVRMDKMAKAYMVQTAHLPDYQQLVNQDAWALQIGTKIGHRFHVREVYEQIYEPIVREYWQHKHDLHPGAWNTINWDAAAQAAQQLPQGMRRWLVKNHSGWCGTGRSMMKRQLQAHDECPLCSEPEDIMHVATCQDPRAQNKRKEQLREIKRWLDENLTEKEMGKIIMNRLYDWHMQRPFRHIRFKAKNVKAAILQQDVIGWHQFFLGRIAINFAETQEAYLRSLQKRRTGLRWTQALINKMWAVSWDLWEYRNGIKHNSITPQVQREMDEVGTLLRAQQSTGSEGLRQKDHHLINTIATALQQPLDRQKRLLGTIIFAREAGAAVAATIDPQLVAQQQLLRNFFTQG
jgi:hypothetical protein